MGCWFSQGYWLDVSAAPFGCQCSLRHHGPPAAAHASLQESIYSELCRLRAQARLGTPRPLLRGFCIAQRRCPSFPRPPGPRRAAHTPEPQHTARPGPASAGAAVPGAGGARYPRARRGRKSVSPLCANLARSLTRLAAGARAERGRVHTRGSRPRRRRAGTRSSTRRPAQPRHSRLSRDPPERGLVSAGCARPRPRPEGIPPALCPGSGSVAPELSESPRSSAVLKSREVVFRCLSRGCGARPPPRVGVRSRKCTMSTMFADTLLIVFISVCTALLAEGEGAAA